MGFCWRCFDWRIAQETPSHWPFLELLTKPLRWSQLLTHSNGGDNLAENATGKTYAQTRYQNIRRRGTRVDSRRGGGLSRFRKQKGKLSNSSSSLPARSANRLEHI